MTYQNSRMVLDKLLSLAPRRTAEAPQNARGIYGLVDHLGALRYIGSTNSMSQTLYERIHQRHRTGSEDTSHYFSFMYNVGRMWRDRRDAATAGDGAVSKKLRNAFIAQHCAAVWVEIPDGYDIPALEQEILRIAPQSAVSWNGRKAVVYDEPANLVEITMETLRWGRPEREAVARQLVRYSNRGKDAGSVSYSFKGPEFTGGRLRFFALDVETANNDRASICQIGIAAAFEDGSIQTWKTYLDPRTSNWSCSFIHGISARDVSGAPTFKDVLPVLNDILGGRTVYQHSQFDSSAIAAACRQWGVSEPRWNWKDSVQIARQAWPELKGNGGHGLASLKTHLGLSFAHHDAAEDARAAAEVVLHAEEKLRSSI